MGLLKGSRGALRQLGTKHNRLVLLLCVTSCPLWLEVLFSPVVRLARMI
jgi:hypothetical protein